MNVLFLCHADFASNSMGHIVGFSRELAALGHSCAAAIPGDDRRSFAALGDRPAVRPFLYSEAWERPGDLFPDGAPADILHAWTPREHVRLATERCRLAMPRARVVVHLEDNEEHLCEVAAGQPFSDLLQLPDEALAKLLPGHLAHPRSQQSFLRAADGITAIVQALAEFSPPRMPFAEVRPGVDFKVFHPGPADELLRSSLGLQKREKVIFYPGNSHFANRAELQCLYDAVGLLNRSGVPCRLVRTGLDTVAFPLRAIPQVQHLGMVDIDRLPDLMRLADVLVQPGIADSFNRYRLPSKIPEFLASGRPVIMPRANVGLSIRPDEDALLLTTGSAEDIAATCRRFFDDPALAERLSQGAAAFARAHFHPRASGLKLDDSTGASPPPGLACDPSREGSAARVQALDRYCLPLVGGVLPDTCGYRSSSPVTTKSRPSRR